MLSAILKTQLALHAQDKVSNLELAETCALMGRNQEAIRYLQSAIEKHEAGIISLRHIITLRSLHAEPGFQNLLREVNLPPL
jgi:hypothetical protein